MEQGKRKGNLWADDGVMRAHSVEGRIPWRGCFGRKVSDAWLRGKIDAIARLGHGTEAVDALVHKTGFPSEASQSPPEPMSVPYHKLPATIYQPRKTIQNSGRGAQGRPYSRSRSRGRPIHCSRSELFVAGCMPPLLSPRLSRLQGMCNVDLDFIVGVRAEQRLCRCRRRKGSARIGMHHAIIVMRHPPCRLLCVRVCMQV